jgi:glycosyltransferase involved in cell wall biosynthesis
LKISWLSNGPMHGTGYGVQTKLFAPRIAKLLGYEVDVIANVGLEGSPIEHEGLKVYPRLGNHSYGQDAGIFWSKHLKSDICINLMDAWVYDPALWQQNGVRWIPWFPIDSEPANRMVIEKIKQSYQPICYSQSAYTALKQLDIDALYVPHGVDTKIFKPKDKAKAREELGWSNDLFYFAAVLHNSDYPSRKAFPEQLKAFAMLHKCHPDTRLYLHCNPVQQGGLNLVRLCQELEIPDGAVLFPLQQQYTAGLISDEEMADMYNAADCLLSVTMGEGFGVPIVEAQACGTPVIVGDWTAMSELCFAGWKISREDSTPFWVPIGSYWRLPDPHAILECMEKAYRTAQRVVAWMVAETVADYDADNVTMKYWKPVLEAIAAKIEREGKQVHSFAQALEVV